MSSHIAQHEVHRTTSDEIISHTRILVVDDDDMLRGLHEAVLNRAGYGTDSASNGEEALVMLATGDFDLVLTDCNMPLLDGVGLVRTLRASGSRIPVMILSGSLDARGGLPADVSIEAAVALPKPAKTSDLLAGVAHALRPRPAGPGRTRIADAFTAAALPGDSCASDPACASGAHGKQEEQDGMPEPVSSSRLCLALAGS
jgi:DNA-binding response OmpR family regulator